VVSPLLRQRTVSASTVLPYRSLGGQYVEVRVGCDLRRVTGTEHLLGSAACAAGSGIIDMATRL